jgi:hypothetical protein
VLAMPGIHGDCFTHGDGIVWDTMAFQIRSDHRYYNVALDCWDRFSVHFIASLFIGSRTGLLVCYAMPYCYYTVAPDCWDRFSVHFIASLFIGSSTGLLVCYAMPCCYYTVSGNKTIFFRQNNFFFFAAHCYGYCDTHNIGNPAPCIQFRYKTGPDYAVYGTPIAVNRIVN